jgi:hypothetical protein
MKTKRQTESGMLANDAYELDSIVTVFTPAGEDSHLNIDHAPSGGKNFFVRNGFSLSAIDDALQVAGLSFGYTQTYMIDLEGDGIDFSVNGEGEGIGIGDIRDVGGARVGSQITFNLFSSSLEIELQSAGGTNWMLMKCHEDSAPVITD